MNRPKPKGLDARQAALRLLDGVLRQGLPLEMVAGKATAGLARPEDRGLALAIAGEVLRRLPDYDALIDGTTKRPLPPDAKARMVLRIALAQLFALGTPPHAVIATALPLLAGGPRRLAHGVLGNLIRSGAQLPARPTLPEDVAARWRRHWGDGMVEAAAAGIAALPPLDLTFAQPEAAEALRRQVGGESLLPGHLRLERRPVEAISGYADGDWWVQDLAASLPARLFGLGEGRRALDLCAAPGGKTLQLVAAGWRVTALDIAESRLARLSENLARTGLSADIVCADLLEWTPEGPFDAVLLDAPCTATGIFRRHPDVIHRVTPKMIADSAALQARMLERAADWVKPGGRFVYAVCSLEPEEGESVVAANETIAAQFSRLSTEIDLPSGLAPDDQGNLRILPGALDHPGGADGFCIAAFERHQI